MNFIVWLIFGALAGWIASMIMKTSHQQGILTDIIVGIVGAFLGGFIFQTLGIGPQGVSGFNLPSLLVAIVGAVVLLAILKAIQRRT